MKPLRKPDGFLCYLVGWDDHLVIKAGVSLYNQRWRSFRNRGATLYGLHDSKGLGSSDLEHLLEIALGHRMPRAFMVKADATPLLGNRGAGYLECHRANDLDEYRDALAACVSIMLEHPGGHCLVPEPEHMHGRTDGRTHGESRVAPKSNLTATYGRLDLS